MLKHKPIIAASLLAAALCSAGEGVGRSGIPPIGELTGTTGSGNGEVALAWHTPLFEDPDPDPGFDSVYEFRRSSTYIDGSTWELATPIDDLWPTLGIDMGWTIKLWFGAQNTLEEAGGIWWIQGDQYHLRAVLYAEHHGPLYFPFAFALRNETVWFYVYDENDNLVTYGSDLTDNTGLAEFDTGDINDDHPCSMPNWPTYTFVGHWPGHSIGLSDGVVVTSGDVQNSEESGVCDGEYAMPPEGWWHPGGGTYHYFAGTVAYEVFVPVNAVAHDVPVQFYTPYYVPPPAGMNPGVPGAMAAFVLEKPDGPHLDRPVTITMQYPPGLLEQYGGLGESSLRAYWFDNLTQAWMRLDLSPVTIERTQHIFRFGTDRLGLLAVAAEIDADHDGLGDVEELEVTGTDQFMADSDLDGLSDGDERWFTLSDPLDPQKTCAADQHSAATGLNPGQGYYIAGRIVCGDVQSDVSNCVYVVAGGTPRGDLNCDGTVDGFDIQPFVLALTDPDEYVNQYPNCDVMNADCNGDGSVDGFDIQPFVELLTGGGR